MAYLAGLITGVALASGLGVFFRDELYDLFERREKKTSSVIDVSVMTNDVNNAEFPDYKTPKDTLELNSVFAPALQEQNYDQMTIHSPDSKMTVSDQMEMNNVEDDDKDEDDDEDDEDDEDDIEDDIEDDSE